MPAVTSDGETRASWKGHLMLDLVKVAVAAYNVTSPRENEIHFHQLHSTCHSRVRHEKVCPIHGRLSPDEIVAGYEFAPQQYVEVTQDELARLRSQRDPVLTLERFVPPSAIEPMLYDGRAYYLVPDDDAAAESYPLLQAAIRDQGRYGVGHVTFSGREQLAVLRPYDGLLVMQMLHYGYQLRSADRFREHLASTPPAAADVAIAAELIAAFADDGFRLDEYQDEYDARLRGLIQAKLAGQEIVAGPLAEVQPPVINFNDALRRSVDRARSAQLRIHPARSDRSIPSRG